MLYVENDRQARSAELIGLLQQYGYRLYWHLPPLYTANNFRADTENIFGNKVSVNMIGIPAEIPQSTLTNLREVTGPNRSRRQLVGNGRIGRPASPVELVFGIAPV